MLSSHQLASWGVSSTPRVPSSATAAATVRYTSASSVSSSGMRSLPVRAKVVVGVPIAAVFAAAAIVSPAPIPVTGTVISTSSIPPSLPSSTISSSTTTSSPLGAVTSAATRAWSNTRTGVTTSVNHIRGLPLSVKILGGLAAAGCMSPFLPFHIIHYLITYHIPIVLAYISSRKVRRILYFWRKSMPILIKYKRFEAKSKAKAWKSEAEENRAWQQLHDESAPKVMALITKLRGVYVKLGQVH
jgi:hypothetical protein